VGEIKVGQYKGYLTAGKLPDFSKDVNEDVLISQFLANRLKLKGRCVQHLFMKEGQSKLPNIRRFKIVGIFNSGFQEFDATYVLGDIRHMQRINKWKADQVGAFEVF
jgi:lipoprotein-releasing system permease protein